jgi:putative transposase
MAIRRYKPEQIVNLLRGIEVAVGSGKKTPQAVREAGINVQTYYRWRKEFGGLKLEQAKRLKEWRKSTAG